MAVLRGQGRDSINFNPLGRWLRITPVTPSLEGPRDEYVVALGPDWSGSNDVEIRCSVHGWQFGHSSFEEIARLFHDVDDLLTVKRTVRARRPPAVGADAYWRQIYMTDFSTRRCPEQIGVDVYYSRDTDLRPERMRFQLFCFVTSAEEARRFGEDLLAEMDETLRMRQQLGLLSEEDEVLLREQAAEKETGGRP